MVECCGGAEKTRNPSAVECLPPWSQVECCCHAVWQGEWDAGSWRFSQQNWQQGTTDQAASKTTNFTTEFVVTLPWPQKQRVCSSFELTIHGVLLSHHHCSASISAADVHSLRGLVSGVHHSFVGEMLAHSFDTHWCLQTSKIKILNVKTLSQFFSDWGNKCCFFSVQETNCPEQLPLWRSQEKLPEKNAQTVWLVNLNFSPSILALSAVRQTWNTQRATHTQPIELGASPWLSHCPTQSEWFHRWVRMFVPTERTVFSCEVFPDSCLPIKALVQPITTCNYHVTTTLQSELCTDTHPL